jgi:hypothetical protein
MDAILAQIKNGNFSMEELDQLAKEVKVISIEVQCNPQPHQKVIAKIKAQIEKEGESVALQLMQKSDEEMKTVIYLTLQTSSQSLWEVIRHYPDDCGSDDYEFFTGYLNKAIRLLGRTPFILGLAQEFKNWPGTIDVHNEFAIKKDMKSTTKIPLKFKI